MPAKITQQVKAHYTPDDIKALIVADMRERGFSTIVSADIDDTENPHLVREAIAGYQPFQGYWIAKDIDVPVKPKTRETGLSGSDHGKG